MVDSSVLVSKLIGALIIFGSFTVKIPLIRNCIEAKSTEGLAESSLVSEILSLTISVCYNILGGIPISTWGEYISVLAQNFVLLGCIWYYGQQPAVDTLKKSVIYFGIIFALMALLPASLRFIMPVMGMIISWSGHIPQILTNYRNKHTGPLAIETQGQITLGAYMRLFTVLAEVDDFFILFACIVGSMFHSIILGQIIFYKSNTKRFLAGEPIEEEDTVSTGESMLGFGELQTKIGEKVVPIIDQIKSNDAYVHLSDFADEAHKLYSQGRDDISRVYSQAIESNVYKQSVSIGANALQNLVQAVPFLEKASDLTFNEVVDNASDQLLPILDDLQRELQVQMYMDIIKEKLKLE
mmetsp:Transcript_28275/g.34449  ORF Transcript_28275/g.34449 Transcript_28275/m.34449 type:complete len:354 (-) Transcript_28275:1349-2410(-)